MLVTALYNVPIGSRSEGLLRFGRAVCGPGDKIPWGEDKGCAPDELYAFYGVGRGDERGGIPTSAEM